jgi:hypothetical protein
MEGAGNVLPWAVANLWKNIQQLKSLNCPFEIDEIRLEAV